MGDQEGFRLKTIKLRGQISQGLILPMSIFGDFGWTAYEGLDVTQRLGIVKYEPPIPAQLAGKVKGQFPSFISKTDEERIQNLTKEYIDWKIQSKHKFYVAEKLDGSSATFYFNNGVFGVCSRNLELLEDEGNSFWKVARQMQLEEKLRSLNINIAIQGELIGEGIQGNPYKIKGQTVKFFNAFNIDKYEYFSLNSFKEYMDNLNLDTVPILDESFLLPDDIEDLIKFADGKSSLCSTTDREGLVIRSHDRTISFKVISNKFLLNEK
jgi:RNA ligase (TIGR02306 family)